MQTIKKESTVYVDFLSKVVQGKKRRTRGGVENRLREELRTWTRKLDRLEPVVLFSSWSLRLNTWSQVTMDMDIQSSSFYEKNLSWFLSAIKLLSRHSIAVELHQIQVQVLVITFSNTIQWDYLLRDNPWTGRRPRSMPNMSVSMGSNSLFICTRDLRIERTSSWNGVTK